jgi:hypothetical protein
MVMAARGYLRNLWVKLRYSHFLRLFFDAISKLDIRISPYYLFQETNCPESFPSINDGVEAYDIGFWGPEEIKSMALIPGRPFSEEFLLDRLQSGHLCLGMKKNSQLVAFTWGNLKEISFKWIHAPLNSDEAYVFDAFTLMEYRGKGIAPFLRCRMYQALEGMGRTKFYSYSDYFNTPAIQFKLKLKAKIIHLALVIEIFKKWHLHFILKEYNNFSK